MFTFLALVAGHDTTGPIENGQVIALDAFEKFLKTRVFWLRTGEFVLLEASNEGSLRILRRIDAEDRFRDSCRKARVRVVLHGGAAAG